MPNLVLAHRYPQPTTAAGTNSISMALTYALRGLSAYDVAVANGFMGTEQAWLESLAAGGTWDSLEGKPATFLPSAHGHAIGDVADLQAALDLKAPLDSAALTGAPTAPTAAAGANTTQIATTAFVRAEVASLVGSAPGALDTLDELAAALGDDVNFAATTAAAIGLKEASANKDASGGYAGLTLFKLNLVNALGTITSWFTTAATVARTWTMPDKDGTVAMTSDTVAGATTQVMFNDAGVLAGDADLAWDKTANTLTVNGKLVLAPAQASSVSIYSSDAVTTGIGIANAGSNPEVSITVSGINYFKAKGSIVSVGRPLGIGDNAANSTTFLSALAATAATLQQGAANAAVPVAQTLQAQGSRAGTDSNVGGANYTIQSGNGTGTGTPSSLILRAPAAVASGTGAQTMTTALTLKAGQALSGGDGTSAAPCFGNVNSTNTGIYFPGANSVAISANGTAGLQVFSYGAALTALIFNGFTAGLRLNASGVVEVNNSNAGVFRDLKLRNLISVGGVIRHSQYTNATEPSWVNGDEFFNTDLDKLRIGGAATWETVTSA